MALSELKPLTQAQYRALTITPFENSPVVTSTGNPDPNAQINLGGWVGSDVLAFTINDNAGTKGALCIDTSIVNQLDLSLSTDTNPTAVTTYWTVNMGAGGKATDWQITFDVMANTKNTGKWVFTKGKSE